MTGPLAGVRILVTRPAGQAAGLVRLIGHAGGEAVAFPVLEIVPIPLPLVQPRVGAPEQYDIVVFVSPNAVQHGRALLGDTQRARPLIAAIGPSTARALEDAGVRVSITPAAGFTSESLLDESVLQDVRGRRVLIVRGHGGRELLAETLAARGAEVRYAEVYERRVRNADASALKERWRRTGFDLATALSVESLDALHACLGADAAELLSRVRLVTASTRVIKRAAALGLPGVVAAEGPDDDALVEAMIASTAGRRQ